MSEKNFIEKYLEDFSSLVKPNADIVQKILEVKNILVENNKNNKKTIIFGNGGSADRCSLGEKLEGCATKGYRSRFSAGHFSVNVGRRH